KLNALKLIGPIAITIGINEIIKKFTGKDPLGAAINDSVLNDAIPKAGSKNPYPQGTSLYSEYQRFLHGTATASDIAALQGPGTVPLPNIPQGGNNHPGGGLSSASSGRYTFQQIRK